MFDIPGTDLRIDYDVWSNIHCGYVGSAAGFEPEALHVVDLGSNRLTGGQDESDHHYAQLGIDLYNAHADDPAGITNVDVHRELMSLVNDKGGVLERERKVLPQKCVVA